MRAAVTGAGGLLGENLVRSLLQQGWRVVGIRRPDTQPPGALAPEVEWWSCDIHDNDALTAAFKGVDVVFHCAALVCQRFAPAPQIDRANVGGTASVLQAVRRARALRLVHCSSALALGVSEDGAPVTEEHAWNLDQHGMDTPYLRSKRASELAVLSATDVDAVVVNPTLMVGPGGRWLRGNALVQNVASGTMPGWPQGTVNYVGARDVADAMVRAAERGQTGERYLLSGENLSWQALIGRIAAVAGVEPPPRPLPRWILSTAARCGAVTRGLGLNLPLPSPGVVSMMYHHGLVYSSEKAKRRLGFEAAPIEVPVSETLAWLRVRPRRLTWDDEVAVRS